MSLLKEIRSELALRRIPVIIVAVALDAAMLQSAYDHGVNSVVRRHSNVEVQAAQYVATHSGEVCPASWKPGANTLKPSLDLVGKI